MNTYTADYFVEGQHFGRSSISADFPPHSVAYFCRTCGEIWARILIEATTSQHWSIEFTPCSRHQPSCVLDWNTIPGTLLSSTHTKNLLAIPQWARAIEHLPHTAVLREAAILFNHHER